MDKTLENTLKTSINTMLPTCDDKGRKGAKELVVIWAYSVALVWLV
jgi:ribosomal protein L13